ncbi:ADP-ribosylglycohydrolase family protein [Tenacibaculum sp. M341]|uniref:ADP-ribosylglycohydrolase family protein n=1 Tax=Tenacibaculum sp. M341 TaxID=2530339 RepID=UPI001044E281|nr:ADP-ribosylglycohydrolase family protein [Tenacibaculum sp. M341]TCI91453.1 hypothetical protein EYW44_10900 [Tenacibaculum sp. M341]
MKLSKRFEGCIICGAIGDAYGSAFENVNKKEEEKTTFYLFGKPKEETLHWKITDDTQLTLATSEVIIEDTSINMNAFAQKYAEYFRKGKITGIGASTLKAFTELNAGIHWRFTGRKGEYAAGNGVAMRVAPLAFFENISREQIRDFSIITHNNDEVYVGALCVWFAIKSALNNEWTGEENLIELLIPKLPDTRLRDRLIAIKDIDDLLEIGKKGNSGYVVDSIPLAIAAANMVKQLGVDQMFKKLIEIGGDTDTNCSIAGQISGALLGIEELSLDLIDKLKELPEYSWIEETIINFNARLF